jgi:HSP20 family protein
MSNTAIEKSNNSDSDAEMARERSEQSNYFTPLVDITETADEFIFQADLPGVKAGDVDINYDNGVLTIKGSVQSRQSAGQSYSWQEYGVGGFYRQFSLGTAVNPDAIRAELKKGVLELHVPKAESAKTRRVEIQTS